MVAARGSDRVKLADLAASLLKRDSPDFGALVEPQSHTKHATKARYLSPRAKYGSNLVRLDSVRRELEALEASGL